VTDEKKLNVVPALAAIALVVATVAVALAVVALTRAGGSGQGGGGMEGMGGMSGEAAAHMAPLPIGGIRNAASDRGGAPLRGVRRNGALEFHLEARPVWWRLFGRQRVSAWAYNGAVPGPEIRVGHGERVRVRFRNRLPDETTVHWHGVGVPNAADGCPA
jgi:FtsP/CotA-like multicopper oxidase with cupredoxin domain